MRNECQFFSRHTRRLFTGVLCVTVLSAVMTGCLFQTPVGVTLIVSPGSLEFGTAKNEIILTVNKNASGSFMGPVVVQSSAGWVKVGGCTDPANNCISDGPIDQLSIPITVDRNLTVLGMNRATLTINALGASQKTVDVFLEDPLQVGFDVSKRTAKVNETLQFTDQTLNNGASAIQSWKWEFGDGNTSTTRNPLHKYAAPGVYDVKLTVTTGTGSESHTAFALVTVTASNPAVDFTGTPRILLEGESVRFTQTISSPDVSVTSQVWNFGDGGTSTEPNPEYVYAVAGVYTVSLTANTNFGSTTTTKNQYIAVNPKQAPIARFSPSTTKGFVNIPIQFTDISAPGTAPIDTWSWTFGDGGTSAAQNPQHTYTTTGTFTVTLTVTSAHGTDSASMEVTIDFKPPAADFTTLNGLTNPAIGENVQFLDTSVAGSAPIEQWQWIFGDGASSVLQNPVKAYTKAGTYTVSLTVTQPTASNNTDTETKTAYISVFTPPVPAFNLSTESIFTGNAVTFTNKTTPGTGTSITYAWDFNGDGNTDSTAVSPSHTYTQSGSYVVTLTVRVTRPVSGGTYTVGESRAVTVDAPPVADFSANTATIKANDPVQFTDASTPGTMPITAWLWNFGDGGTSASRNPTHTYTTEGQYTVSLTVTALHSATGAPYSVTETKTNFINVTPPQPPTAGFTANNPVINTGQSVVFVNSSTQGTGSGLTYLWNFGDGGSSAQTNPSHMYSQVGDYTVTLTVTTSDGSDSLTRVDYVTVRNATNLLEQYVNSPDGNYSYQIIEEGDILIDESGFTEMVKVFIVDMKSQKWRDLSDYFVTNTQTDIWQHYMYVICPAEIKSNTTLLFISGGSNSGGAPPTIAGLSGDELLGGLGLLAAGTDTVITLLEQVPNQPLSFMAETGGEPSPLRERSEDEIIAFTFDQFLQGEGAKSSHQTWPLLFPMVKSAVRAMDTVQSIYTNDAKLPPCTTCAGGTANRNPVRDFFVTGGSKRGWTTWLTGAVDTRVKAMAPLVIDVLNMDKQMAHHFAAYGYWAPSIYAYAQEQVFDRFLNPDAEALLDAVDPFKYRSKVSGIPKYLINSSGDQFFLPDSAQWYYDQLLGEKYINYVPNTDHGLGLEDGVDITDPNTASAALFSFYAGYVSNVSRPAFSYTFNDDGTISVSSTRPFKRVTQWSAHNPDARDFRREIIGEAYTSQILNIGPGGKYTTTIKSSDVTSGWTAVYIQVQFDNPSPIFGQFGADVPFVFTTPVRVLPENPDGSNLYPTFDGRLEQVAGQGFTIPVAVVQGSAYEMGRQYGELLSAEINGNLPAMLAAAQAANPLLTDANLDAAWNAIFASADVRIIEEIEGIADGSGLDLLTVQRANMVAVLDQMSGTAFSTTRDKTIDGRTVSNLTLNWTLNYSLQDYPVIVMYIPGFGNGVPHASVTFAGLAVGLAGLNLGGIMAGAVIDPDQPGDPAPSVFTGHHVTTLTREILYSTTSYGDVLDLVSDQIGNLFRRQHLIASDGGNWRKSLKAESRPGVTNIWDDNAPVEEFSPLLYTSYSVSAGTGLQTTIFNFINSNSGSITQQLVDATLIPQITGGGGNLLNVQFDVNVGGGEVDLWVSYALGATEARQNAPVQIRLTDYLP